MTDEASTRNVVGPTIVAVNPGATIAAIASPPGPGARGIVRVSGPVAGQIVRSLWVGEAPALDRRALHAGRIDDGRGTQPALLLWMPGPRSYTGEDVAELHVPGSPPLLAAVLARVLELGATPAKPGEFTRRAFENGRMDLTRAEGVADLIAAVDAADVRAAGALLLGGLGTRIAGLRDALDEVRALCEASLDFDEADTGHVATEEIATGMRAVRARVDEALAFETSRARATGRARIVLCGAPNAGKSALFNQLRRSTRTDFASDAIESDFAGTTRDTLEASLDVDGVALQLLDTPGFDDEAASVDAEAQRIGREHLMHADVALWVVDATGTRDLARERAQLPRSLPVILAWNKIDLVGACPAPDVAALRVDAVASVSARTGAGLDALRAQIAEQFEQHATVGDASESGAGAARERAARHLRGLAQARAHLDAAEAGLAAGEPLDLVAETLRQASAALDEIDGRTTPEDLLDRIFARFCLGK